MTLNETYIHLQQGLQNIAAFVGRGFETWELDYLLYNGTNKFVDLAFPNTDDEKANERYSDIQSTLDDLRSITIANHSVTITESVEAGYTVFKGTLPSGYRHLVNDRTIVSNLTPGCTSDTGIVVPNRLTKQDELFNVLENKIHKTSVNSPVSKLDGANITVYASYKGVKQFQATSLFIDYVKQPTKYEYATNANTTVEFPDNVLFKIIKTTVIFAATIAEQNPNKIQLLARQ
jgi:hypothetical protein